MKDIEFNLLEEKWILVRKSDCTVDELSLKDALLHAHEYESLAGELPTQDVSILRLMLAVLHTVFSQYSPTGEKSPLKTANDAINRWRELWNAGAFPEKPIDTYLSTVYDRFWLFHPERPFYQTPAAKIGTEYSASKLNGTLSESSNKIRLFSSYTGENKQSLSFAEGARWLLYVNNYDDTSAKPKGDNLPSPGAGWLGRLGLIYVNANNLFETLMYNLILLKPPHFEIWADERPIWELDKPRSAERTEIAPPDNLSELYTLQSRRLWLIRKDDKITGYNLLGGDFFEKEDAFIEPMTIWSPIKAKKQEKVHFQPKRHNSSVQMWREFSSTFLASENSHTPGIISWIQYLKKNRFIERQELIRFGIASVQYGDKDFFINDVFSDTLTFHTNLLTELGRRWQSIISNEVSKCDELARTVTSLGKSLLLAAGSSGENAGKLSFVGYAREQLYYEIDVPFRSWLENIDPVIETDSDEEISCIDGWHDTARKIAFKLGSELVNAAGPTAIIGHADKDERGDEKYYSAADAYRSFKYYVNKIYPKEECND